jgi:uncharacterized protein (DUF58 family)
VSVLLSPTTEPEVIELAVPAGPVPRAPWREGILWIVAAGVMIFAGVLKGINLVIVLGYGLIGLWLMNWILARRAVRGLSARRLPRAPVQAGVPAEWAVEVRDDGPATGTWILEERVREATAAWLIIRAGRAGSVFRPRIRAAFPRRGKFTIEPLVARSGYPFGLIRRSVELLPADELIVLPRPARVDGERLRAWLFRAWAGRDEERRKLRRVVEREAEVHGLRDYRPGDPPRRVHWKATARRSRLTVREYEDAAPPRLLVIVDPWLPERPSITDHNRLERVISLTAGVVREWRREAGARMALLIAGPTPVALDGPPGPAVTEKLLTALAVEPGGSPGDVTMALGQLTPAARAVPALVLSSRADSPVAKAVSRALGRAVAFADASRAGSWYHIS